MTGSFTEEREGERKREPKLGFWNMDQVPGGQSTLISSVAEVTNPITLRLLEAREKPGHFHSHSTYAKAEGYYI